MKYYTVVNAAGSITQTGICDDSSYAGVLKAFPESSKVIELETGVTDYLGFVRANCYNGTTIVPRGTMVPVVSAGTITANGTAEATITGLPNPCVVTITGVLPSGPTQVTDGEVILTSNQPGDLIVNVTAEPSWIPWSTTIDAV